MHKFLIISQLITLICVIFAVFCYDSSQNSLLLLGILSFGILHGANDLKIIDKKKTQKKFSGFLFCLYLVVVFLGIIFFILFPELLLFLLC